jgi:hypothetical protein
MFDQIFGDELYYVQTLTGLPNIGGVGRNQPWTFYTCNSFVNEHSALAAAKGYAIHAMAPVS